MKIKLIYLALLSLFLPAGANAADKPNIVYFLVDNLGQGEIGCYGGAQLRGTATPRIDQFAAKV